MFTWRSASELIQKFPHPWRQLLGAMFRNPSGSHWLGKAGRFGMGEENSSFCGVNCWERFEGVIWSYQYLIGRPSGAVLNRLTSPFQHYTDYLTDLKGKSIGENKQTKEIKHLQKVSWSNVDDLRRKHPYINCKIFWKSGSLKLERLAASRRDQSMPNLNPKKIQDFLNRDFIIQIGLQDLFSYSLSNKYRGECKKE